jgi:hypothetical protein
MELYDPPVALTAQDDVGPRHLGGGYPADMPSPIFRIVSRRNR